MKIGLVRNGYSPTGGAERYLLRLYQGLQQAGHEPVLVVGGKWPAGVVAAENLFQSEISSPAKFAEWVAGLKDQVGWDFLFSLERLHACDGYRAGDGVHRAWLERRQSREPFWKDWFRRKQSLHREVLALEESLFEQGQAGQVIANSRMVAAEIESIYHYPANRIKVVYNGLTPSDFQPAREGIRKEIRSSLGLADSDRLALLLGSGWERKGLKEAVAAVQRAGREWHLAVVGRGKRGVRPRGGRVHYPGPTRHPRDWFEAADLFLLPTWYDPFSNASLEAWAAGLPVVTTRDNGFAEVMSEADGGVVDSAGEIEALAGWLEHFADPIHNAEEAREERSRRASAFTIERNVRETLAALGLD